jgi:hypothetical protein
MHLSLNNSLGKWILPKEPSPFSPEATNYFSRLDAAGDTTYVDYKQPLANYIDGLVTLGGAYWNTMESAASFVGVGIQGITVPLRNGMTVPTQSNFVSGDLSQLTGLLCDGTSKKINTNTDQSNYAQNDTSASVYRTETVSGTNPFYFGTNLANGFGARGVASFITACYGTQAITGSASTTVGLLGLSRSASTGYDYRSNGTTGTRTTASVAPAAGNMDVFAIDGTTNGSFRLATYHAGPALNLATLEGLQATLLSEIRTAHTFVAAASYFSRLVAAGDTAHVAYKQPLTNYITSLVELGGAYWDTMLSATSFVGVGIQGITVPLRDGMTVPTNNNFVAGDLNQLTGLKGGNTKELATGILDNQFTTSNASASVYATEAATTGAHLSNDFNNGAISLRVGSPTFVSLRGLATNTSIVTAGVTGLIGLTRNTDTDLDGRASQTNVTEANAGTIPRNSEIFVLSRNAVQFADSRLATYHLGSALNLATLEGLQATLLAEIAGIGFSTEAANYFSRLVNAGDTTFLAYRQPLANYIDSLVALGGAYWDDMKSAASFVGVGIQGVTVPLRDGMTVPTQSNFVAADLDQLTGLKGDASTKYIDMGILSNDIAQNDGSLSVYQTAAVTSGNYTAGSGYNGGIGGGTFIRDLGSTIQCSVHGGLVSNGTGWVSGLVGASRSSSTTQTQRTNQTDYPFASTSLAPTTGSMRLFMSGTGSPKTDPRLATYHAGPALNLATLEGLQDTLITEIAAI